MKICIVIQSDAFRTSAGMRIRYDRFRACLADSGDTIDAATVAELESTKILPHDVYIFCKTFDTTALLLARRIRASGKVVGQDLFDDYFSQYSDQRLERFRQWLRDMAPVTHFAICSTARMVEAVKPYLPDVPVTAIEDPVDDFDPASVAKLADAKAARARETRELHVAWFGIGDNPFFPVGLVDLASCEPELARMERLGWSVRLRIVTNRRPFDGIGAEVLRKLSTGYELIEWSEEAERAALLESTIVILPVNGQRFSQAKSMNRAVTAINAGCQVLSLGYPVYRRLDEFIYRSTEQLLTDLEAGRTRIGGSTTDALSAAISTMADPVEAATRFVDKARRAESAVTPAQPQPGAVCLIHGRQSTIAQHKAVAAIGGLSVATIFSKATWNFPVRFDRAGRRVVMRVTPQIAARYQLPLRDPGAVTRVLSFDFVEVDTIALMSGELTLYLSEQNNPILDLAVYEDVMRFAQDCCRTAFPGAEVLMTDSSPFVRRPSGEMPAALSRVAAKRAARLATYVSISNVSEPVAPAQAAPPRRRRKASLQKDYRIIASSSLFDAQWYLSRYPDVAASGADAARHFVEFGWMEGRNPGPEFSTKAYLKANPDVAGQGMNPLVHYLEYGRAEGRVARPAPEEAPA